MNKKNDLQEVLQKLCEELVDRPDDAVVSMIPGERHILYEIKVDKSDVGKILGREGRNIKSLRNIAQSIAAKNKFFANVEIHGV